MQNFELLNLSSAFMARANAFIDEELDKAGFADIQPAHGDIFAYLFTHGGSTVSELTEFSSKRKSTISELVNKLAARGYVRKQPDPKDGRGVIVSLTDKGKSLEPVFRRISSDLKERIEKDLTADELASVQNCLRKLIGSF